ncbi:MAG: hypothetical protein LH630_05355, partial [Actinomycetia bacterium]|nr:hypothetical protein [Actinomycetes bacterium]
LLTRDDVYEWFAGRSTWPGVTVVSSEALWSVEPRDLLTLLTLAGPRSRVVVVFRCLQETALSGWHTAVAEGYPDAYEGYVSRLVLGGQRRDFDYEYHLEPIRRAADVVVVDYRGNGSLMTRLIEALELPGGLFAGTSLDVPRHVRPSGWLTSLLLTVHRDNAMADLGPYERASVSEALRNAAKLIEAKPDLMRLADAHSRLSDEIIGNLVSLCLKNRSAAQDLSAQVLLPCPCSE